MPELAQTLWNGWLQRDCEVLASPPRVTPPGALLSQESRAEVSGSLAPAKLQTSWRHLLCFGVELKRTLQHETSTGLDPSGPVFLAELQFPLSVYLCSSLVFFFTPISTSLAINQEQVGEGTKTGRNPQQRQRSSRGLDMVRRPQQYRYNLLPSLV